MESKDPVLVLFQGEWDRYYENEVKRKLQFRPKEESNFIRNLQFYEYEDHSKSITIIFNLNCDYDEVIELFHSYEIYLQRFDITGVFDCQGKLVKKVLALLLDHFDFNGEEENIANFFNDVSQYPGNHGTMVKYYGSWSEEYKNITYRRKSLDNFLVELNIYHNPGQGLYVMSKFSDKNRIYKLVQYLRSKLLFVEVDDFIDGTLTTRSTEQSLQLLQILKEDHLWFMNDNSQLLFIIKSYD